MRLKDFGNIDSKCFSVLKAVILVLSRMKSSVVLLLAFRKRIIADFNKLIIAIGL